MRVARGKMLRRMLILMDTQRRYCHVTLFVYGSLTDADMPQYAAQLSYVDIARFRCLRDAALILITTYAADICMRRRRAACFTTWH